MKYFKKLNAFHLLFIFILSIFVFIPTSNVHAAAQCSALPPIVQVTSNENKAMYSAYPFADFPAKTAFGSMAMCMAACPGYSSGLASCNPALGSSGATICTYYPFKHASGTTYPTPLDYCAADVEDLGGGLYCIPENYNCPLGTKTLVDDYPSGGGWCTRVYSCSQTRITGSKKAISYNNCSVPGSPTNCFAQEPSLGYCEYYRNGGQYTETYNCTPASPPTGVDVDATIWTNTSRNTVWSSQTGDGPLWAYSQAPYRVSWGAVGNASSCYLSANGGTPVSVSVSGGDTDNLPLNYDYVVASGQTTLTFTLNCTSPTGDTASNSVTINIPPRPTIGAGSCPSPGSTGSFSWTAPSGYTTFDTQVTNTTTSTVLGSPGTETNFVGTSKTFTSVATNVYKWEVRSKHIATGAYSDWLSGTFTCGGAGSCVDRVYNDTTSGFYTAATGGTKFTDINPGQAFFAKCDYGISTHLNMGASGSGVSCPTWVGWDVTAATAGCTSPTTPGVYTFSCNITADPTNTNSCAESNPMTSLTVKGPDLTASAPPQNTAVTGTPQTFTSNISNTGTYTTGLSFYNTLQIATDTAGTGSVFTAATPSPLGPIANGAPSLSVSASYTFSGSPGLRYARFCADKNTSMVGTIDESNESNNCSAWTQVAVTSGASTTVDPDCDTDPTPWYSTGGTWNYRRIFAIDDAKVPSTLTNFPVLISTTTDSGLRLTPNGGVANTNGYDILFTNSLGTKLYHEIEKYNPATGELVAWVNVSPLNGLEFPPLGDTMIYMYYGNASSGDQQNKTAVWDANYKGVWHLPNGTTLSGLDSKGSYNSTSITASASNAKIDGGATFSGAQRISLPNIPLTTALTLQAWIRPTTYGDYDRIITKAFTSNVAPYINYNLSLNNDTTPKFRGTVVAGGVSTTILSTSTIPLNTWSFVTFTWDGSNMNLYLNGTSNATPLAKSGTIDTVNQITEIGYNTVCPACAPNQNFTGSIDEARISSVARSANWIATEYNNQSVAPYHNFYGVSTQCALPMATADIKANGSGGSITVASGSDVNITWTSTDATSCTITPPNWTGVSGNQTVTNILSGITYTQSCQPGPGTDSVTVNVTPPVGADYDLCIIKSGQGTVTRNPAGTPTGLPNCWTYDENESVTLTATPATGRIFTGWSVQGGGACAGKGNCTVIINGDKTVTANFAINPNYKEF